MVGVAELLTQPLGTQAGSGQRAGVTHRQRTVGEGRDGRRQVLGQTLGGLQVTPGAGLGPALQPGQPSRARTRNRPTPRPPRHAPPPTR